MIKRTHAREHALQVLYYIDTTRADVDEALRLFTKHFETKSSDEVFSEMLVRGVIEIQDKLDVMINERMDKWKVSRLPRIDRNIIRLGVYEILHVRDTPSNVVMDEAIELGKKFGDAKTGKFVNGILDRFSRDYPRV